MGVRSVGRNILNKSPFSKLIEMVLIKGAVAGFLVLALLLKPTIVGAIWDPATEGSPESEQKNSPPTPTPAPRTLHTERAYYRYFQVVLDVEKALADGSPHVETFNKRWEHQAVAFTSVHYQEQYKLDAVVSKVDSQSVHILPHYKACKYGVAAPKEIKVNVLMFKVGTYISSNITMEAIAKNYARVRDIGKYRQYYAWIRVAARNREPVVTTFLQVQESTIRIQTLPLMILLGSYGYYECHAWFDNKVDRVSKFGALQMRSRGPHRSLLGGFHIFEHVFVQDSTVRQEDSDISKFDLTAAKFKSVPFVMLNGRLNWWGMGKDVPPFVTSSFAIGEVNEDGVAVHKSMAQCSSRDAEAKKSNLYYVGAALFGNSSLASA